jgi:hypothetical protein
MEGEERVAACFVRLVGVDPVPVCLAWVQFIASITNTRVYFLLQFLSGYCYINRQKILYKVDIRIQHQTVPE